MSCISKLQHTRKDCRNMWLLFRHFLRQLPIIREIGTFVRKIGHILPGFTGRCLILLFSRIQIIQRRLAQNQDPSLTATVLPPKTVLGASCTYEQEMMLQFANSTITMLTFDWYIASAYAFDADANRSIASKLVVLHGTEDALVSTADAKAWESLAAGGMQLIEIPGDHNIITNQTHACMEQILKLLS